MSSESLFKNIGMFGFLTTKRNTQVHLVKFKLQTTGGGGGGGGGGGVIKDGCHQ